MRIQPITPNDLKWWLELAPTLKFKKASTYEETAPHVYVVRDKHLESPDFDRACRVIHTFGVLKKFYARTNAYLIDEERGLKWWTMGMGTSLHGVINQADKDVDYGTQNAPDTRSTGWVPADGICTWYDEELTQFRPDEGAFIREAARDTFGAYAPTLIDIGAGTGQVLDTGVTSPMFTTVVDPSQGMLNHLALKHKKVKTYVPRRLDQAGDLASQEMATAMGGTATELSREEIAKTFTLGRSLVMLSAFTKKPAWRPDIQDDQIADRLKYIEHQAERFNARSIDTAHTRVFIFKKG